MIVLVILLAWQIIETWINFARVNAGKTSLEFFIPTPLTVLRATLSNYHQIVSAVYITALRSLLGFSTGAILAILIVVTYAIYPPLRATTLPFLVAFQSFPITGLAPALILAFGQGSLWAIVFISAFFAYFPILISLDNAVLNTRRDFSDLAFVYNASTLKTLLHIQIPLAMPALFASLRIAIPGSIVGATLGEMLGTSNGIGRLIVMSLYQLKSGLLYGGLIVLMIISFGATQLFALLEKHWFPWILLERQELR